MILEPRNKHRHEPDAGLLYDCIVIGTGVAGYAAAMYGARLGMKVLLVGEIPGGTLALTEAVENYPGFVSIGGQELTGLLEKHAMDYGIGIMAGIVKKASIEGGIFSFACDDGKEYRSRTAIMCTGARVRKLGVPGEDKFFGRGVGYCALCDAAQFKGRKVAIAGGGDSAVKEAILLAEHASKVCVINNEPEVHPEHANLVRMESLVAEGRLEVINNNEVGEIYGESRVEGVLLKEAHNGSRKYPLDGVFVYIGHIPESGLAISLGAKANEKGEITVGKRCETNVPGLFAAGDVTDLDWKQAIIGVSQGVTAAYYAYRRCQGDLD